MRGAIVAILLVLGANAEAKPLPAGMKVAVVKKRVMISQSGASVPLPGVEYPVDKVTKAELSDDGKSLAITIDACEDLMADSSEPHVVPLAQLQAKFENIQGMALHSKKKYADAITHFIAAVQGDPQPVYVTNLLSAQTMAGKLDDADKTLATWGKPYAPWIVWRLAVDSDLKKLVGRPSTKLGTEKPGKATSKLGEKIAYSSLGFAAILVAADFGFDGMPGGDSPNELVFVDLASGKEVLRLPAETVCDDSGYDGTTPAQIKACKKREAAKGVKLRKVSDPVLAALGFEVVGDVKDAHDDDLAAPDGKPVGELPDGTMNVGFVPKATVFIVRHKIVTDCAGTGMGHMEVTASPRK